MWVAVRKRKPQGRATMHGDAEGKNAASYSSQFRGVLILDFTNWFVSPPYSSFCLLYPVYLCCLGMGVGLENTSQRPKY